MTIHKEAKRHAAEMTIAYGADRARGIAGLWPQTPYWRAVLTYLHDQNFTFESLTFAENEYSSNYKPRGLLS